MPGQPLANFKFGKHSHYSSALYSRDAIEFKANGYVKLNRLDEHITALAVVVTDDVGETKTIYDVDGNETQLTVKAPKVEPSFIIETKPGSQQRGYILKVPLRDLAAARIILESIKAVGYSDPNANTQIGRVFRIPSSKPPGKDNTARLVDWTGDLFDAATLLDELGIPKVQQKNPRITGTADAPFHISEVVKEAFGTGMNDDLTAGLSGKWDWFERLGSDGRRKVVESALNCVVGTGRGDWLNVAMALVTLSEDWGEEVFMQWSAEQPDYNVEMDAENAEQYADCRRRWDDHQSGKHSLPDNKIRNIASLFHDAESNGWDASQFINLAKEAADSAAPEDESAQGAEAADAIRLPGLPKGYVYQRGAIYKVKGESDDGDDVKAELDWICDEFEVAANTSVSSRDNPDAGRLLRVKGLDGRVRDVDVPYEVLHSPNDLAKRLLPYGLEFLSPQALAQLVRAWRPKTIIRSVRKVGWSDSLRGSYMTPNGEVIGKQGQFRPHRSLHSQMADNGFARGTLDEWIINIAAACVDNPCAIFGVSAAFAGPLLQLMDHEGGGIHFYRKTSGGKTVLARMMSSVWGGEAYMQKWNTTANALENTAAAHNDCLLVLDDMAQADKRRVGSVIYMLGDGRGKGRMKADSSAQDLITWRILLISTGEKPSGDYIKDGDTRAHQSGGQAVRLVDIPISEGPEGAFPELHDLKDHIQLGQQLKKRSRLYCGTAGPAFVEYLMKLDTAEKLENAVETLRQKFLDGLSSVLGGELDNEVARALDLFIAVAIAGELATYGGITGWPTGAALNATTQLCRDWLDARGSGMGTDDQRLISALKRCLQTKHHQFEQTTRDDIGQLHKTGPLIALRERLGWFVSTPEREDDEYWFAEGVLGDEMGMSDRIAANRLAGHDLLRVEREPCSGKRRLKIKAPRDMTEGRPRLYCVSASALDDDADIDPKGDEGGDEDAGVGG